MLKAGDKIGAYTLLREIGRGGFGIVWLAEKRSSIVATQFAIKIPRREDVDFDAVKREAELWVRASGHPNILPIIEAEEYDGRIIIVSEYAPDGSLTKWLRQHGGKSPSIEAAIEIMRGILAGLNHLHSRRIIHRDLKPDNILLQGNTPRLSDFGIARVLKTSSESSKIVGTFAYMAPETFDGKRNEQTDIWSAGVIFHQLLTGRLPFPQTDTASLIKAIMLDEMPPLPDYIPQYIRGTVQTATAKEPSQRFQSAEEMRMALSQSATGSQPALIYGAQTLKFEEDDDEEETKLSVKQNESKFWGFIGNVNDVLFRIIKIAAIIAAIFAIIGIILGVLSPLLLRRSNVNANGSPTEISESSTNSTQTKPAEPPPTPSPSPSLDIHKVNFRKMKYPLPPDGGLEQQDLKVTDVKFGDLDDDGNDEAVVQVLWSFGRDGGTGYGYFGYLYTVRDGKLKLLKKFDGGSKSDRFKMISAAIANNELVVTQCELPNWPDFDPQVLAAIRYTWTGKALKQAGKTGKETESCW